MFPRRKFKLDTSFLVPLPLAAARRLISAVGRHSDYQGPLTIVPVKDQSAADTEEGEIVYLGQRFNCRRANGRENDGYSVLKAKKFKGMEGLTSSS